MQTSLILCNKLVLFVAASGFYLFVSQHLTQCKTLVNQGYTHTKKILILIFVNLNLFFFLNLGNGLGQYLFSTLLDVCISFLICSLVKSLKNINHIFPNLKWLLVFYIRNRCLLYVTWIVVEFKKKLICVHVGNGGF